MKTAISVPDELFSEVDNFAKSHHYSRSHVFVLAAEAFIQGEKNKSLSEKINAAFSKPELEEERKTRKKSIKRFTKRALDDY